MKNFTYVRESSPTGSIFVALFFVFISFLYAPQSARAAITDGLTITVNREAVTATALEGATVKIKCNAGTYTDVGVTTNSSGVVSITDLTTLTNLLLNAGTCIVGSSLDVQVSKDGYVTTEKLGAVGSLLDSANSFTFTGSDSVKFAHKATITREGDGAALSGATVGVGATVCIEAQTLGIYYCPVPIASDGATLSIAKSGYVTNTSSSVGNRTSPADVQGVIAPANILFQVKIAVADELGNSVTPTSITFDGSTETASSSNVFYFAPSAGLAKVVVINKTGFIPNALTNTALANVSADNTGQTSITLGSNAVSSSPVGIGQALSLKGLEYALKSVALKSELGGTITNIANGTPGATSADISLTGSGGVSVITSAVASDVIYIAATGNGSGDDSVSLSLNGVTVDGMTANTAYLSAGTIADTGNLLSALTSQTTFGIGQATGNIQNTTGFGYPLKVTVADELGTAINISDLATKTFGGIAVSTSTSNIGYWAATTSSGSLVLAKNGYVSSATNNTGLTNVTADQTATTSITFGSGSALTSSVSAGSGASAQGLQFAQKINLQTEAGESLTGATVTAGSSNTSCTVASNIAYCPVPVSEDGIANDITVTKSGYVTSTSGDTANRTANADAQSTQTFSDAQYALKVVVNDSNGVAVVGATVTHGGVSAAASVSNSYYFTSTGAGAIAVSKSGFDSLSTSVDTGLANVGVTSSGQTVVTLTGSTPFTGDLSSGGSSGTGRGLVATAVSSIGNGAGSSSSSSGGRSGGSSIQRVIVPTATTTPVLPTTPVLAVPALCTFDRNLSIGDTGIEVSALQAHLEAQGLLVMPAGASKGYFGSVTKASVIAHQGKVNVPTTGYFGPMTRAATCNTAVSPSTPVPTVTTPATIPVTASSSTYPRDLSFGFTGDDVTSLQTLLESKGYLTLPAGTTKGFFGDYTRAALMKYQSSVSISPTGIFGPLTRASVQGQ